MNKAVHKALGCLTVFLFSVGTLFAQDKDTLQGGAVVIVKDFEPTIVKSEKIHSQPTLIQVEPTEIEFNYDFLARSAETTFSPDSIKAARMKGEPLSRLYRGYVKMGLGNYGTTLGNLKLNNLRSRNMRYGLSLNHLRTQGNVRDVATSTNSHNGIDLFGTRFFKTHELSANASYHRDVVHLYGFDPVVYNEIRRPEDFNDTELEQFYSVLSANASLKSYHSDSADLNYTIDGSYTFFESNNRTLEHRALLDAAFSKFYGEEQAELNALIDFNNRSHATDTINNLIIGINPQLIFRGPRWRVNVGLKAMIENQDDTEFRFYPNAHFKYNIVDDLLVPYAGITGGLQRQNLNHFTSENPFVATDIDLLNKNVRYEFYGGIRGSYNSTIAFNLRASRSQVANYAMYVNSTDTNSAPSGNLYYSESTFQLLYDTMDITHISGEISYHQINRLKLVASGNFWLFDPKRERQAWHLPQFRATLTGHYDIQDKIVLTADVFFISNQFARSFDPTQGDRVETGVYAKALDGTIEINIGAEYRLNKKLSGYIRLNNVAAIEYQRFNNYPTQRFNFLAGFTYSFWGE